MSELACVSASKFTSPTAFRPLHAPTAARGYPSSPSSPASSSLSLSLVPSHPPPALRSPADTAPPHKGSTAAQGWLQTLAQNPKIASQMCAQQFRKFDRDGTGFINILDAHAGCAELCILLRLEAPSEARIRGWHQGASPRRKRSGTTDVAELLTEDEFTSFLELHLRLATGIVEVDSDWRRVSLPLAFSPPDRFRPPIDAKEESTSVASTSAMGSYLSQSDLSRHCSSPRLADVIEKGPEELAEVEEKQRDDDCDVCGHEDTRGYSAVGGASFVLLLLCLI